MEYKAMRYGGSNCHVFTFNPKSELRFDVTIGKPGRLERLSTISGEPHEDESTYAKLNGGFFNMDGSAEFIGTYIDEGKYHSPSAYLYPTLIFWNDYTLAVEHDLDVNRLAYIQGNAFFAIGVPWTLVIDGKVNYTYPMSQLIAAFGHPMSKAPRTLVGQRFNGDIVWVVVEGRRLTSPGLKSDACANLMINLGCKIAVNVDGGGSSEMFINGQIKNKLSDGAERYIGTAFMAYKPSNYVVDNNHSPIAINSTGVTTAALNVRKGPSTEYGIITTLVNGTKVSILNFYNHGWYHIKCGTVTGYVSSEYVMGLIIPAPQPDSSEVSTKTGVVSVSVGVNVRTGPGTSYKKTRALPYETKVTIYEEKDGWYRIGNDEWVYKRYIK